MDWKIAFEDRWWVMAFEISIGILFFWALLKDLGVWILEKRGAGFVAAVKRGDESRKDFLAAYAFASVLATLVLNSTDVFKGYKTSQILLTLVALLYLAYASPWAQNRVLGVLERWKKKVSAIVAQ